MTEENKKTTDVKFEDAELEQLNELQTRYQEKYRQFGDLKVRKLLLEQQVESLESFELQTEEEYKKIQSDESELVAKLNEKYGPGTLDPSTGKFTPQPSSPK